MSEELIGGQGKCRYCGEIHNNISFHETFKCRIGQVRRQWKSSADWEYNHKYDNIWSIDLEGRKVIR